MRWIALPSLLLLFGRAAPDAREVRLAVVLVEFKDQKRHPRAGLELVDAMFFSSRRYIGRNGMNQDASGSLADYVEENSRARAKVAGRVFDWVQVGASWSELRKDDAAPPWAEAMERVIEREGERAFEEFTHVIFVYAGSRRDLAAGHPLWPGGRTIDFRGERIEATIVDAGTADRGRPEDWTGVGFYAHELGHTFGLKDHDPTVGAFCLMDARRHGTAEHRPPHLCAPCKLSLGWIEPETLDPRAPRTVTLRPVERTAQVLRIGDHLIENRQRLGFDRNLPSAGLLIWRVKDGVADLVEAHGIETRDASARFEQAIAFPQLTTMPLSRDGLGITDIRVDDRGVVTVEIGGDPPETITYERKNYRILPVPSIGKQSVVNAAVLLVDCDEAPHGEEPLRRFRDFFFEHGPSIRAGNGTLRSSVADYLLHASYGALSIEGGVIPWVRLGTRADVAKARSPVAHALEKIPEKERALVEKADLLYVVFAGAPVQRTFFNRQAGAVKVGARDIPYVVLEEAGATADLLPAIDTVYRALARPMASGERVWCVGGRTSLDARNYRPGPGYPCAFCREQLGWVRPVLVTSPGSFAIAPSAVFPGQVVKMPVDEYEYYLVENRVQWEFDRVVPREGLAIWHVTPADKKCVDCWEKGVLDVWMVHDRAARTGQAAAYTPFLSLLKGLSLRLTRYEVMGIKPDDRGNMYFEVDVP